MTDGAECVPQRMRVYDKSERIGFMDFKKIAKSPELRVILRQAVLAACLCVVCVWLVAMALNLFTRHNNYREVPDFVGIGIEQVRTLAARNGLEAVVNDSLYVPIYDGGTVLDQNPAAGKRVKSGRKIYVTTNSYKQKLVEVPYVAGFSLRQAKNSLEVAGLEIDKLVYRDDIATNYVLEQRYGGQTVTRNSGLQVEVGSGITLVVGRDAESGPVSVPRLVGFPLQEAKSRLWELGINVGDVSFDEGINLVNQKEAKVYEQSPAFGSVASLGSSVSLKLSLDEVKVSKAAEASAKRAEELARQRAREEAARAAEEE